MLASTGVNLRQCAARLTAARGLSPALSGRKFTPRRAVLYVPGADQRKIEKAASLSPRPDCVVLDCEDGVALGSKTAARNTIRAVLDGQVQTRCDGTGNATIRDSFRDLCVRVNGVEAEGQVCEQDLTALLSGERLPDSLMVPKIESREHIDWLWDKFKQLLSARCHQPHPPIVRVILFCESASSLIQLADLCSAACERSCEHLESQCGGGMMEGWVFGSDDYCADIGVIRSPGAEEVIAARQHVVTVARAMRLQAIDVVYIDYKDSEGLQRQASQGAAWGFTGKQVIHPNQVGIVQEAFSPSERRVDWAKRVVDAFTRAQDEGRGAFSLDGQMVDMPLVQQALNVLSIHEASSRD